MDKKLETTKITIQLDHKDSDVINKGPGRSIPTMESKNIITTTDNFEKIVFIVVRVSRFYGCHNVTIPNDIYESRSFAFGSAKTARFEERDKILLTSNGLKRLCWGECPGKRIGCIRRTEETNSTTGMCVWLVRENSRVEDSIN